MLKSFFLSEESSKCDFKSKAQVYERCFFLMKWNVICNAEVRFSCVRSFCRASHVRASMHRITSLELLRTLMLCLVQLSKLENARPRMLKSFFLSERKLQNAILRVMLLHGHGCWKATSQWEKVAKCNFKSNFHVLDLFCRASHVRASMHRITSLELLRTLMLCLVQLSKLRECKATDAEKLLSQWEKVAKCNFKSNALARPRMLKSYFLSERKLLNAILRVKLKYMKDVSFSWN